MPWSDNGLQSFLPCKVNGKITLIGVWTKQANSPTFEYIGQLWKYLQLHKDKMSKESTVLCGDLNSSKIWDVWDRWWNHSDVVRELREIGMCSIYHTLKKEDQGNESIPTFYMYRKIEKPYHIDYAFVSKELFCDEKNFISVGETSTWLDHSDHVPLIFSING